MNGKLKSLKFVIMVDMIEYYKYVIKKEEININIKIRLCANKDLQK